jgi:hypothetical protein
MIMFPGWGRLDHDRRLGVQAAACGRPCTDLVIMSDARRGWVVIICWVRCRPDVAAHAPSR